MHAEISQAKKQASFFAEQVEKGKQLKKLEEKVKFSNSIFFSTLMHDFFSLLLFNQNC